MSKTNKKIINKKTIEPINKNKALLEAKIKRLLKNGRQKISTKEKLDKYSIGSLVSYINKKGIFKSGGYLFKKEDEYFVYLNPDENKKYRVRYDNIKNIIIGDVYSTKNDVVSIIKPKNKKTKYPVKIGNVVIYYAQNNYDKNRFMCTAKYKTIKNWYDIFGNDE